MSPTVLGKITSSADRPRGPDVEMTLTLPEDWISAGATVEIELPRNLRCASCSGGGCDTCDRSGAVSLRGRKEPAELFELTLPKGHTYLLMRIPDRGGLPKEGSDLPRGNLLLSVNPGELPQKGITRLPGPSIPPPRIPDVLQSGPPPTHRTVTLVRLIAIAVALAVLAWIAA